MKSPEFTIKESKKTDLDEILLIHKLAFNEDEVAVLTNDLLKDKSAEPLISLMAMAEDKPVGHILFTRAYFQSKDNLPIMYILAPLGIIPAYQNKGVGGMLIKKGLNMLKEKGTDLVFVLGHKTYYPKYGFIPDAGRMGFSAPYPIPEKDKDAWMVQSLSDKSFETYQGRIKCAIAMDKPEYWRE